jgi:sulfatase modifying factor 1
MRALPQPGPFAAAAWVAFTASGCAFLFDADTLSSDAGVPTVDARSRDDARGVNGGACEAGACEAGGCSDGGCIGQTTATSCQSPGDASPSCGEGQSCCTSGEVEGGTYYRTYTPGAQPSDEHDPATVSRFRLDAFLVTVGRFRQFAKAWSDAGYLPDAGSGRHTHLNGGKGLSNSGTPGTYESGWIASDDTNLSPTSQSLGSCNPYSTWTDSPRDQETLPITCVNWWEAYAFCIWDGGFLPSEAEWEYAAAGGSEQREYAWGTTDPGMSNDYEVYGCNYPSGSDGCMGVENIAPVGTAAMGAGLWGQLDMAGEVWEWNLDWGIDSGNEALDYVSPCTDCAYVASASISGASERVDRGGDFGLDPSTPVSPPGRDSTSPGTRAGNMGFRCARKP